MIPIQALFEGHVTVKDLDRARTFYEQVLNLTPATIIESRRVAFYWLGGHGKSMLGVWEVGSAPSRLSTHLAFRVSNEDLERSLDLLRAAGIKPLDLAGRETDQPVLLEWMPARAVYFEDPDGNLLEFLAMTANQTSPTSNQAAP